jgi:hypothetical protein
MEPYLIPAHPGPCRLEQRGWHDLMHCYILDFIVQNFVYFNDSGKMPSDKAALCHQCIQHARQRQQRREAAGLFYYLFPPTTLNKVEVDFIRAIKTKRQSKINLQLPSLSAIFNIRPPCLSHLII